MGIYKVQDDGWAPKGLAVGDLVVTGAGTYQIDGVRSDGSYSSHIYNKGQTTASYTGRYDDPNDKKTTQIYGKNLYRNLERIENNKNDTLNMLDSQKDELNKGYDTNAQHIYANYMMNNKNMNEQLIRAGLSDSGMTESSQIASNAAYGANLTENETSRNMALKQIDDAKLQVERDAADAEAQAYSDYDNSILAFNQQKDAEWKQDKANNKVEMQTKLGNSIGTGYVPTDEELATAGWTREYYDSLNETAIYNNTSGDMRNQLAAVAGTGYVPTDEELAKAGWTRGYWDSLNKAATPQVRRTSSGDVVDQKDVYEFTAVKLSGNAEKLYNAFARPTTSFETIKTTLNNSVYNYLWEQDENGESQANAILNNLVANGILTIQQANEIASEWKIKNQ